MKVESVFILFGVLIRLFINTLHLFHFLVDGFEGLGFIQNLLVLGLIGRVFILIIFVELRLVLFLAILIAAIFNLARQVDISLLDLLSPHVLI